MNNLFLITTAMKDTWAYDKPALMLGNWCKIYSEKESLKKFNNLKVLDYHWDESEKVKNDYQYLKNLYEIILKELSLKLNILHNTNFSTEYWRILIGHWLTRFLHICFDRWEVCRHAFSKYEFENTKILKLNYSEFTAQSNENFIDIVYQDKWNHFIFSEIIKSNYSDKIKVDYLESAPRDDYLKIKKYKNNLSTSILQNFLKIIDPVIKNFRKNEKFLISESYLGKKDEIKLNLKLGLFPYTLVTEIDTNTFPEDNLRKKLILNLNIKNNFEKFLNSFISKMIPCSYVENYNKFRSQVLKISWPKNPKVIFTSHFLCTKTFPSFYVAAKKEQGAKLIHGQHGGSYGQSLISSWEDFEVKISDLFLSWGWKVKSDNSIKPLGIIKPINRLHKISKIKNKKKLLIVLRPKERYFATLLDSKTRGPQLLNYHKDCIKIGALLDNKIKKNLIVRLHTKKYLWCEKERWQDSISNVQINEGHDPMYKLLEKSKLVIYTYNSTGYLEYLSSNIPVVIFWNSKENLLNAETENFFNKLKKIKIFHETAESLSAHINENWENLEKWWFSKELQEVRVEFCEKYCKINKNKVNDLKNIITKIGKS